MPRRNFFLNNKEYNITVIRFKDPSVTRIKLEKIGEHGYVIFHIHTSIGERITRTIDTSKSSYVVDDVMYVIASCPEVGLGKIGRGKGERISRVEGFIEYPVESTVL